MTLICSAGKILATLDASEYDLAAMHHYEPHLAAGHDMLCGMVTHADEERLVIEYATSYYAEPVLKVAAEGTFLERLELARKFSALNAWQARMANPELSPDNLIIAGGQLLVAHRGLEGYIEPKSFSSEEFIARYKALAVSVIKPKYSFDALASGAVSVRDPFCREILESETIEAVEAMLDEEIRTRRQIDRRSKKLVKKTSFTFFRLTSAALTVAVLGMGVWIGITLSEAIPLQERIIESQASFIVSNYGDAVSILHNDDPSSLPRSAQYVLASSYVQLENLSLDQRNAVINHLSPISQENELLYWISIGRGEFYDALDIALNIGDNQLVLLAYTRLYDMVNADPVMPGAEKQERLDQYRTQIEELAALLDGDDNE